MKGSNRHRSGVPPGLSTDTILPNVWEFVKRKDNMPSYEKNKSSGLWSARFREIDANGIAHQKRLSGFKTKKRHSTATRII